MNAFTFLILHPVFYIGYKHCLSISISQIIKNPKCYFIHFDVKFPLPHNSIEFLFIKTMSNNCWFYFLNFSSSSVIFPSNDYSVHVKAGKMKFSFDHLFPLLLLLKMISKPRFKKDRQLASSSLIKIEIEVICF